jgi:omega-6 fatty acid desaturase (delta-12 desaturase)
MKIGRRWSVSTRDMSSASKSAEIGAARTLPYRAPSWWESTWQLTSTLALFGLVWGAMLAASYRSWPLVLALAPLGGMLRVRLFMLAHDCSHGSFYRSRLANDVVGFLLMGLNATPYGRWRRNHRYHHASSGNLDRRGTGDLPVMTVEEYRVATPRRRLRYRFIRQPLVFFVLGPILVFLIEYRFPLAEDEPPARRSVHRMNLFLLAVFGPLAWWLGWRLLLVELPMLWVASVVGVWLLYVQHHFDGTYWQRDGTWDFGEAALRGSSYYALPRVLHWFTGNIGFHHVHHLDSNIPNYRLEACHRQDEGLLRVRPIGLIESLSFLRYRLWDEAAERHVGFD